MVNIEYLAGLKDRNLMTEGICVGEGRFVVERMLARGMEPLSVLSVPGMADGLEEIAGRTLPLQIVPQPEIGRIAGFPFHRGLIAAFRRPEAVPVERFVFPRRGLILILDAITDPVNLGGILRSAAAFGADAAVVGPRCGDPYSRRAIRASMAACFTVPLIDGTDTAAVVNALRRAGSVITGADLCENAVPLGQMKPASLQTLILGNEGHGIQPEWRNACSGYVSIPILDTVDSLNVGVAAGILLYHLADKRNAVV